MKRQFTEEETRMAKKHMKKMLNLPKNQGNANLSHKEIPFLSPHTGKNLNSPTIINTSVDMEQQDFFLLMRKYK